eukprot:4282831-Pyramimonas_sp.AAC.1
MKPRAAVKDANHHLMPRCLPKLVQNGWAQSSPLTPRWSATWTWAPGATRRRGFPAAFLSA